MLSSFSLWCAQQQSYWAAIYLCLCFSLGLSFIVLAAINPRLADFRKTQAHWYIFAFLLAKGMAYVPFFIPLTALFGVQSQQLFSLVCQVLESAALTSAILSVVAWRWKNSKRPNIVIVISPLVVLWYLASVFPQATEESLLSIYRYLVSIVAALALLIHLHARKEEMLSLLRWCVVGWICFTGIDYMVWDSDFPINGYWGVYRFVYWVVGALALSITTIGCSRLLITRDFVISRKIGHARQMLLMEWASIMLTIALAAYGSEAMLRGFYTDIVNKAQQSVISIRNHIIGFEGQLRVLSDIARNSGRMGELFGDENQKQEAIKLIESYIQGSENLICYALDLHGHVVAQISDKPTDAPADSNYLNADYFIDVQNAQSDMGYEKETPHSPPSLFCSIRIEDPTSHQMVGVVVFKKILTADDAFGLYKNAFLLDSNGQMMLSGNPSYDNFSKKDFLTHEALDFARFSKIDPDSQLLRIKNIFYVLSSQQLDEEGSQVAILYEAKPMLVACSILYITIIWFLIFIICIFIFTRYVLARSDMELEQAQELHDILACTPNCVALLDKNLQCLRIEGSGVPAFGVSVQELIGRPFVDIWTKLDTFFVKEQLKQVFTGEKQPLR